MKREYSCGAVLYTVDGGVRKYVLIMEPNGAYGFPKGHRRRTEDDIDCALREIKEETGIDATILPNFKRTIKYNVFGKVKIQIELSKVCYLPGEAIKGSIILTPKFNLVEEIIKNPKLKLNITQYQLYTIVKSSDAETEKKKQFYMILTFILMVF